MERWESNSKIYKNTKQLHVTYMRSRIKALVLMKHVLFEEDVAFLEWQKFQSVAGNFNILKLSKELSPFRIYLFGIPLFCLVSHILL
jgi:hypothetical protein